MRIKANKMALNVLAALRSCFFSVDFLVFFLETAVVTARAVDAKEGVDFWSAFPLINCLGTNLVSRGKELISSTLLRLSAVKEDYIIREVQFWTFVCHFIC